MKPGLLKLSIVWSFMNVNFQLRAKWLTEIVGLGYCVFQEISYCAPTELFQ